MGTYQQAWIQEINGRGECARAKLGMKASDELLKLQSKCKADLMPGKCWKPTA